MCVPLGSILSGTVKVTVQTPCASGVMVRPVIWVPSAYRFIDSVPGSEVPVIVMPSVQSVSSPWASIAGAQDIVNVTSFDSYRFYTIIYSRSSECVFPWINIIWDSQGNCPDTFVHQE